MDNRMPQVQAQAQATDTPTFAFAQPTTRGLLAQRFSDLDSAFAASWHNRMAQAAYAQATDAPTFASAQRTPRCLLAQRFFCDLDSAFASDVWMFLNPNAWVQKLLDAGMVAHFL
eukprot:TRINITY_DN4073_c0_g1_i4.p3 TRINITY_DN4073_c0_g1~~TRINITY_DN4073_c0_g1_i4.p3  ORF type:complete len:115 (-),score=6.10 TRINITY_DN4073_c0_g1_i4:352-696(-)